MRGGQHAIVGEITLHPQMDTNCFTRWIMPEEHHKLSEDQPLSFLDWRGSAFCFCHGFEARYLQTPVLFALDTGACYYNGNPR